MASRAHRGRIWTRALRFFNPGWGGLCTDVINHAQWE